MLNIVTGPPAAGKTTYVKTHSTPNAVTIDYDALAQSLGSTNQHDHTAHHIAVTSAAWNAAVKAALIASRSTEVWIIHSIPNVQAIRLYKSYSGRLHVIDPGQDLVTERCLKTRPAQAMKQVEKWYRHRHHPGGVDRPPKPPAPRPR